MPWIARKAMTLGGENVPRGAMVPQTIVDSIPPGRFASMTRIGYLEEVTTGQALAVVESESDDEGNDELCPHCGAGPFARLAQHISQMHKE